jgi:hypothetical protein
MISDRRKTGVEYAIDLLAKNATIPTTRGALRVTFDASETLGAPCGIGFQSCTVRKGGANVVCP